jgi:hypothetical protein
MKNKMEIKVANKGFKYTHIFWFLLLSIIFQIGHAQKSENKVFFYIDKSDTLIKKQFNSTTKGYSSYLLIDENRIKELNKTPLTKGEVWIPKSDDDFHNLGPSFRFSKENDQIINQDEFNQLDIIKERKEFLKMDDKVPFDLSNTSYYFVEPINCKSDYLIREVFPVIFE